jgi:hypothetical protein
LLRIPVDTVVIDTTAALRTELLAKLQKQGVYSVFMADRRLISRISDVKAEQYRRYMAYASLVVVNMVEKGRDQDGAEDSPRSAQTRQNP